MAKSEFKANDAGMQSVLKSDEAVRALNEMAAELAKKIEQKAGNDPSPSRPDPEVVVLTREGRTRAIVQVAFEDKGSEYAAAKRGWVSKALNEMLF